MDEQRQIVMQDLLPLPHDCLTQYAVLEGSGLELFGDKSLEIGLLTLKKNPKLGLSWLAVDAFVTDGMKDAFKDKNLAKDEVGKGIIAMSGIVQRRAFLSRAYPATHLFEDADFYPSEDDSDLVGALFVESNAKLVEKLSNTVIDEVDKTLADLDYKEYVMEISTNPIKLNKGFIEILSICLEFATAVDVPMTLLPNARAEDFRKCLSRYFDDNFACFFDKYLVERMKYERSEDAGFKPHI